MIEKFRRRKKFCFYCKSGIEPNYKLVDVIRHAVTERGKILPRRITGVCAKHQRKLTTAIKRARYMALLPFVAENVI